MYQLNEREGKETYVIKLQAFTFVERPRQSS
jgi:hypothetical protein